MKDGGKMPPTGRRSAINEQAMEAPGPGGPTCRARIAQCCATLGETEGNGEAGDAGFPEQKAPEQGAGAGGGGCSAAWRVHRHMLSKSRWTSIPPVGLRGREMRSCVEHPARTVAGDSSHDRSNASRAPNQRTRQHSRSRERFIQAHASTVVCSRDRVAEHAVTKQIGRRLGERKPGYHYHGLDPKVRRIQGDPLCFSWPLALGPRPRQPYGMCPGTGFRSVPPPSAIGRARVRSPADGHGIVESPLSRNAR